MGSPTAVVCFGSSDFVANENGNHKAGYDLDGVIREGVHAPIIPQVGGERSPHRVDTQRRAALQ